MPTTTNLGLTYPASTGYVTNGASDMGTLASGIDAFFGAATTYSPTFTNVSGGTTSSRFTRMGKIGIFSVGFSAGTATALGSITVSLPSGWTTVGVIQVVPARNGNALCSAAVAASGTTVTVYADAAGASFAAAASLTGIRLNGWLMLA